MTYESIIRYLAARVGFQLDSCMAECKFDIPSTLKIIPSKHLANSCSMVLELTDQISGVCGKVNVGYESKALSNILSHLTGPETFLPSRLCCLRI